MEISIDKMYRNDIIQLKLLIKIQDNIDAIILQT